MPNKPRSPSRRVFLQQTLAAMPAVSLLGTLPLVQSSGVASTAPTPTYLPRYFTAPEWEFLNAAVDRLIPANEDGPGALEAGVPEFIDREMETAYGHGGYWYMQGPFMPQAPPTLGYQLRFTPRELYRTAMAAIDEWCQKEHQKKFAALDPAARDEVLHKLELGEVKLEQLPAATFFNLLWTNTKEGYFSDPMYGGNKHMAAWKMIGFPGARADFSDWIDQPGKPYPFGPVSIRGNKA